MSSSPSVAVVGAATTTGRAVLGRLAVDDRPVLAVDGESPPMPPGSAQVRLMDARDRLLPLALEGVSVLVHAAFSDDLTQSPEALYGTNVGATRNVLEAAGKAGVDHLVVISSATVYGAHDDNPVPLDEDAPLRANPGFAYAYQRQLVEEMVADWAAAHPSATVTVLRPAPVLAAGVDHSITRLLRGPRLLVPAGRAPLWQFCHPDDIAEAVALLVDQGTGGTFNVAADGWMTTDEVARSLGVAVAPVGLTTFGELLRIGSRFGLSPASPEVLPYLSHPWVVDVSRLRTTGWRPSRSNHELLSAYGASVADTVALGTLTLSRRALRQAGTVVAGLVALALWRTVRRP